MSDVNDLAIRSARSDDLATIVAMLADDVLGAGREKPDEIGPYVAAFAEIEADPAQLLVVAEQDGEIVGSLQLTVIPGLSLHGARRAQLEGVRVRAESRGQGIGEALINWAVDEARRRECLVVQFSTNRSRTDAQRFYQRLGFEPSHIGFKLVL